MRRLDRKKKKYLTQQKIDDARTIFQLRINMLRINSNFGKGGRYILCAEEESTRNMFECKGFEDILNIEMYEEITSGIEDIGKKE